MTLFWILASLLPILIALCGFLPYKPKTVIDLMLYWTGSFLAQSFAPQFSFISIVLIGVYFCSDAPLYFLIANTLSTVLFGYVYYRGIATQEVVNNIVKQASSRLCIETPPLVERKSVFPVGFRPLKLTNTKLVRHKNIAYGEHGKSNLLDIYQPQNNLLKPSPIFIYIPGGAWVMGSKNEQGLPLIKQMAENGWTCFSINYRLGPKSRFPAMLDDVLQAITWIKAHASDYGANPNFIAMAGGSAGGHLVSLAALSTRQPNDGVNTGINLAVPIYGRYDFLNRHQLLPDNTLETFLSDKVMPGTPEDYPELWDLACPESQVHKDAPPFLIIHGSSDAMIPVEEARAFASALDKVSQQAVDYVELPGAQHGFDLVRSSWAAPTIKGICQYLNTHYQHYCLNKNSSE